MSGADQRPYDCCDAVGYLYEHISLHGNRPAQAADIMDWGKMYRKEVTIPVLKPINDCIGKFMTLTGLVFKILVILASSIFKIHNGSHYYFYNRKIV